MSGGPPKAAFDVSKLSESQQIEIIGRTAESGQVVGFFVKDDATADRYIEQMQQQFKITITFREHYRGMVLVKAGPLTH